jgi:hypothetical protein
MLKPKCHVCALSGQKHGPTVAAKTGALVGQEDLQIRQATCLTVPPKRSFASLGNLVLSYIADTGLIFDTFFVTACFVIRQATKSGAVENFAI